MSKNPTVEIGPFVDGHPVTAVVELLGLMKVRSDWPGAIDDDVFMAYLMRVADSDGVPDAVRSIARQLYREWDLEAVGTSAVSLFSLGGLLH